MESWLSQDISDSELVITGYAIFRRDRNRHGSGIIIFVKDTLSCTILPISTSPSMEFISLIFEFCSSKFCVSVFYRPPSSVVSYFELFDVIEKLDIVNFSNYILVDDFNINFCNPTHPLYLRLTNMCHSFMLTQVVTEPTHTSPSGNQSLIDLVFCLVLYNLCIAMFLPRWIPSITIVLTSVYCLTKALLIVSRHHQELSGDTLKQISIELICSLMSATGTS